MKNFKNLLILFFLFFLILLWVENFTFFSKFFTNYDIFILFFPTFVFFNKQPEDKPSNIINQNSVDKKIIKRLTKAEQDSMECNQEQINYIVGSSLGDIYMEKQVNNVRLKFEQSEKKSEYINHLFEKFKILTPQESLKKLHVFWNQPIQLTLVFTFELILYLVLINGMIYFIPMGSKLFPLTFWNF